MKPSFLPTALLFASLVLPSLGFAQAGPTPPQPGDLPPWVNTQSDWVVISGVTYYWPIDENGDSPIVINCDEKPAECAKLAEESFEDPPAEDPPAEPPAEEPPSEPPKRGWFGKKKNFSAESCDVYLSTLDGEICGIADDFQDQDTDLPIILGFWYICPSESDCGFEDFAFVGTEVSEMLVPLARVSKVLFSIKSPSVLDIPDAAFPGLIHNN